MKIFEDPSFIFI